MPRKIAAFTAVICGLVLSIIGVFLIYSASRRNFGSAMAIRQFIWLLIGLAAFFLINSLRRRTLHKLSWWCYGIGVLMLILTLFFGVPVRGGHSWLDFGLFKVQSSEIMKLFLIMTMATLSTWMSEGRISKNSGVFLLGLLVLPPVFFILLAGDTGTSLIYMIILVAWYFILGAWREGTALLAFGGSAVAGILLMVLYPGFFEPVFEYFLSLALYWQLLLAVLVVTMFFYWAILPYLKKKRITNRGIVALTLVCFMLGTNMAFLLKEYQRARLIAFVNPYQSPLGTGYNIIQAQIALGSGGWFGQGYLRGSQSQLGFVPELWTDFIYTVGVEELGLFFGMGLLVVFIFLVYGAFSTAALTENWWDYYVCAGAGTIWVAHIVVNLGVCVGLFPVMGLPLPFLSYGGSFMLTNWLLLGIVVSLSDRPRGLEYM